jgi:hypothetical protein
MVVVLHQNEGGHLLSQKDFIGFRSATYLGDMSFRILTNFIASDNK